MGHRCCDPSHHPMAEPAFARYVHNISDGCVGRLQVTQPAEKDQKPTVMTFEILEKKKAGGASNLSLGAELTIIHGAHYTEVFEDLDEILANFVSPYIRHFTAALEHKKFVPGTAAQVKAAVLQQCVSPASAADKITTKW